MLITKRDVRILLWTNSHGMATAQQIATYLEVRIDVAYRRLLMLVKEGYLKHERVFYKGGGVYSCTSKGVEVSNSELPPLKNIRLGTYKHDIRLIDLSNVLKDKGRWVTERQIRNHAVRAGRNFGEVAKNHFPDAYLINDDGKFAIELELSVKNSLYILKIVDEYIGDYELKKVLYYCGSESVAAVVRQAVKKRFADDLFEICLYEKESE